MSALTPERRAELERLGHEDVNRHEFEALLAADDEADRLCARVARLEAALRMASDELQHDYAHTHPVIVAIDAALAGDES